MSSTPLVVTYSMRSRQRRTPLHLNQVAVSAGAYPTHTRRRRGKLSELRHLHLASRGQRTRFNHKRLGATGRCGKPFG